VLAIAMKLKRCGGEMRLIIPGGAAIDQRRRPVSSLIKAVSRASDWVRKMESGECKHQLDLAKATKLEPRYYKYHPARCFPGARNCGSDH
jgi:site-specific DNA recombinase